MKIAAIKKLCVATKQFVIITGPDRRQWISDGANAYPVEGFRIFEHSIPELFDLKQKQADKMKIRSVDLIDDRLTIEPYPGETKLEDMGAVWYAGGLYRVLGSYDGLIFVSVSCLKPADSATGFLRFVERTNADGNVLIAVYSELLVGAIVSPVSTESAKAILAVVRGISLQEARTFTDPDADEAAEKAELEAEEAMRRAQQQMDLGEDEGPEDGEPSGKDEPE